MHLLRGNIFFKKNRGFTIVEIMLVVTMIIFIGGISAPVYQSFQVKNDLDVMIDIVSQSLRRAQILAQSGNEDSAWGVHVASGRVIIFKGSDFSSRDANFDEAFDVSDTISISGIQEIYYSKLMGEPQPFGDIILTNLSGDTKIISINKKGIIEY